MSPSRRDLHAVFFDVGNTLSHVNYPIVARALADAGVPASAEEVRLAEIRSRVRMDRYLSGRQSMEGADIMRGYCRYVLEEIGPAAAARAGPVIDALQAYNAEGNLWDLAEPTAPAVVRSLRERGFRVGVISNADGRVAQMLERQGVASLFDTIVDSGIVRVEKPDPAIFHHAARLLGVEPRRCVHIGDFFSIDVVGSRRAGMEGILLDPIGAWVGYDCTKARSLEDAARIILER